MECFYSFITEWDYAHAGIMAMFERVHSHGVVKLLGDMSRAVNPMISSPLP